LGSGNQGLISPARGRLPWPPREMVFPKALPDLKTVEEDVRHVARWVSIILYTGIIGYAGMSLFNIFMSGPRMFSEQLPQWESMPWMTLCLDNGTATFTQSIGFVSLGFGHTLAGNAFSGDCAADDAIGYNESSRWILGVEVEHTAGRCHRLNLTRLSPFALGTTENTLMIGGFANYKDGPAAPDALLPKFIAVSTSDSPNQGLSSVFADPLLYLFPQRIQQGLYGGVYRIHTPSYALEKQKVPREPLPWLLSSGQRELYAARNVGDWSSCVPRNFQEGGPGPTAGDVIFAFGLVINTPTVKSVYSVGVLWRVLSLIGGIGGWCGISMILWRCIFVRPHGTEWPSDQEQRTLHPHLKLFHESVKGCMGGSSASARELEEPFFQ